MQIVFDYNSAGDFSYSTGRGNISLLPDDIVYSGNGVLFQGVFSVRRLGDLGLSLYVEPEDTGVLAAKASKRQALEESYSLALFSGIKVGPNTFSASGSYQELFDSLQLAINRNVITGSITVYNIDKQPLLYTASTINNGIDIYKSKVDTINSVYKNAMSQINSATTISGVNAVTW